MPVAAHHKQARRTVNDMRQNDTRHIAVSGGCSSYFDLDIVPSQVSADVNNANINFASGLITFDNKQFDGVGFP
jgi:hypothetical protein